MTDSAQDNLFGDDYSPRIPMGIIYDEMGPLPVETDEKQNADEREMLAYAAQREAEKEKEGTAAGNPDAVPSETGAGTPETAIAEASPELVDLAHNPLAQQLLTTGENSPAIESSFVAQSQQAGPESSASPAAPTSLEKAIGSIRLDGARQENFVMLGDPRIQDHFYNNLRALGKINGRGELLCSLKDAEKHYVAAAKELGENIQVVHAMDLSYQREGSGVLGSIKSGIQNALGRDHHMVVMVAGDQATVDTKMKELGGLVQQMVKTKMLPTGTEDGRSKVEFRDATDPGSLVIPEGGLNLRGTGKIQNLVNLAADVVNAHTRAEAAEKAEREALRNKEAKEKVKEAREKASGEASAGAEGGTSNSTAQPVNAFALEQADKLAAAMASPDGLKALERDSVKKDGSKGSMEGVVLVRGINKITTEEFATLPAERRQEMLVQLAALVVKAESKELDPKILKAVNEPVKEGMPFREKLAALVRAEPASEFAAQVPRLVQKLVSSGVLQSDQVEKLAAIPGFESASPARQLGSQVGTITQAGPQALTAEQAKEVLDKLGTLGSAAVKNIAPDGAATTEALARIDGVLKEVESGRFGVELAERVPELRTVLQVMVKANEQAYLADTFKGGAHVYADDVTNAQRQNAEWLAPRAEQGASATASPQEPVVAAPVQTQITSEQAEKPPAEPVKMEVPQETVKPDGVVKEGIAYGDAPQKGVESGSVAAESFAAAPTQAAPARASDAKAAQDTDLAIRRLKNTFGNAPGMLLEKDSNAWREDNVKTLARAVTFLDPAEVAKRPASERAVIVAQAKWVEAQAAAGRLPGFASGEGKALAGQMKARVAELEPLAKPRLGRSLTERTAQRQLRRADGVLVMKELTHAVHRQPRISEARAKYLLAAVDKSGLSLESMKDYSPAAKAETAVALDFVARKVNSWDIGGKSEGVQRQAKKAAATADQMFDTYAKDPQVAIPLTKASFELADRTGALDIPAKDAQRGAPDKAVQATEKAAGHEPAPKAPDAGRERGER